MPTLPPAPRPTHIGRCPASQVGVTSLSNFKSEQEFPGKPSSACFPDIIEALCQLSEVPGVGWSCLLCRQVFQGEFSHLQRLRLISTPAERWSMSSWSALSRWATDIKYVCTPVVCTPDAGGASFQISTFPKMWHRPPLLLPTQQDFPRISNYLQSHIAIYHTDAMWSLSEGIWQNYMLLKKRKKYSIFHYPKGSLKLDLFFQDTHTRGVTSDPGRFLIKGIQDNDNFQHD